MESRAHALVALVFLALLTLGLIAAGLWMHHSEPKGKVYDVLSPYSVSGLQSQAAVRFKGVKVGEVQSIGFDPKNPRLVRVRIRVARDTPITRATFAELQPQGVTGLSYLSLSDSGTDFAPIAHPSGEPPVIPMHPSFIEALSRNGESLVNQGNTLAQRLNAVLDERNRRHFAQTIAHLDQATAELVTLERSLEPALAELPATIAATRSTMEASHSLLLHLNDLAVSAQAPLASVTAAARSVQLLSAAGLSSIETLNYQTLPELNQLSSQLAQSSRRLGKLSENLEDAPQSLVFGRKPPPPGPGQPGFASGGRP